MEDMTVKEIVKRFYEKIISQNRIEEVSQYVSHDCCVKNGFQSIYIGVEGMQEHIRLTKLTYPDYTMNIINQFADGDYVISYFLMEGTHKGEWIGIKPTNKKLSFTGVNIDKVVDGKIVEHCGAVNTFETLLEANLITAKQSFNLSNQNT